MISGPVQAQTDCTDGSMGNVCSDGLDGNPLSVCGNDALVIEHGGLITSEPRMVAVSHTRSASRGEGTQGADFSRLALMQGRQEGNGKAVPASRDPTYSALVDGHPSVSAPPVHDDYTTTSRGLGPGLDVDLEMRQSQLTPEEDRPATQASHLESLSFDAYVDSQASPLTPKSWHNGAKRGDSGGGAVPDLHRAALLNDARTCESLLRARADVHATDASGRTGAV